MKAIEREQHGAAVVRAKLALRAAGYRVQRCKYNYNQYEIHRRDETLTTDVWGLLELADKYAAPVQP